jgi:enoyl-CoA hydratase
MMVVFFGINGLLCAAVGIPAETNSSTVDFLRPILRVSPARSKEKTVPGAYRENLTRGRLKPSLEWWRKKPREGPLSDEVEDQISMSEFETVSYEIVAPGIARIMQNKPDARNAQDLQLTYELNDAFDRAAQDETVKVILFGGEGPHFSAGHDLKGYGEWKFGQEHAPVGTWGDFYADGPAGLYAKEMEIYIGMCRRWRDIPKPTIAMVQGKCIAGGLMLAWVCDIIVAADDAQFIDPVVGMGVCGVEYFAHPYELGIRKAKELLFTADWWDAEEAHRLGMVNQVVPRAELEERALEMAKKIAEKPAFALKMTKQAVNTALDNMGQRATQDTVFGLHHLCHAHNSHAGIPAKQGKPAKMDQKREAAE